MGTEYRLGRARLARNHLAISYGVPRIAFFLSRKCGEAAVMLAFFCGSR